VNFKSQIMLDVTNIFFNLNEFADVINYNGKEIKSVIEIGEDPAKGNEFNSHGSSARAVFWIAIIDVKRPLMGDVIRIVETTFVLPNFTIDISEIDWSVVKLLESCGGMHKVECTAYESVL